MNVLITGAVDGLGRALANKLLAQGHSVVAVDNNRLGLHELTQRHVGLCESRLVDMSDLETVRLLADRPGSGPFDLVILNAGISAAGKFEEIPADAYERLLKINARAPMILASGLVRSGQVTPKGKIVFISSLSHDVGYPGAAVYAASKDAITIYVKSVRKAFKRRKVGILTVFPGPIKTEHAEKYSPKGANPDKRMEPAKLADMILKAANRKQTSLYPGLAAQFASIAGRYAPGLTMRAMRKAIFDKLDDPQI